MNIRVWKTESGGRRDITLLLTTLSWSGDYKSACRELSFGLISSPTGGIPAVSLELGDIITFEVDGLTVFAGSIVSITRQSEFGTADIRCFDRGRILKGNQVTYQFSGTTPEEATRKVAQDFGIELGELAETGIKIKRNFVGVDIYSLILTMYTLAGEQNGKKYIARFNAEKFCVLEKTIPQNPVRLSAGYNLMDLTVSESIENLVNRIQIYNDSNAVVSTKEDAKSIEKYGSFQNQIKEGDGSAKKAEQALSDKGPSQKITVNNLGNISCLTGSVVILTEPHTGLSGEFYIDSDTHTWKNGQYFNKLVLNLKNIMDEKSSGKED